MGDLSTGVLVAAGAAIVAGFLWLLRNGFKSAVAQEFKPLADALAAHMANEEVAREEQNDANDAINGKLDVLAEGQRAMHAQFQQNELDHLAFTERLHNLENPNEG